MAVRYLSCMWPFLAVVFCALCCEVAGARYGFFRKLGKQPTGRRVFGGGDTRAGSWPAACALLDRALEARCSCAVLAARWALTAAHCAVPAVAYVQYNGPERSNSSVVPVRLIYSHPGFKAVERDLGAGMDVVTLHHDIGLVRTRADMQLAGGYFPLPAARTGAAGQEGAGGSVSTMVPYDVQNLLGKDIDVLGYGMTEQKPVGERLRAVQLKLVACERDDWQYCSCALGSARGVCAGDSGGPVLYNGTQIGVTSMGPVECGAPQLPQQMAMSVFTQLRPYARLIDDTMRGVDSALMMRVVPSAAGRGGASAALFSLLLCSEQLSHSLLKTAVMRQGTKLQATAPFERLRAMLIN